MWTKWFERRYIRKDLAESLKTYSGIGLYGLEAEWIGERQFWRGGEPGNASDHVLHGHVSLLHSLDQCRLVVTTHFTPAQVFETGHLRPDVVKSFIDGITCNSDLWVTPGAKRMGVITNDFETHAWTERKIRVDGAERDIETLSSGDIWLGCLALDERAVVLWSRNFPFGDVALSTVDDVSPYFEYLRA